MLLSQLYYLLYFPQKMHLLMAVSEFPVQTLLLRRILLHGSSPPDTGIYRNTDVLEGLLYLTHQPLTPFATEALRPRYALVKAYSPSVEISHFSPLNSTHMPGLTSER